MLGTEEHRDTRKRSGAGMKRPFSPPSETTTDREEEPNSGGAGFAGSEDEVGVASAAAMVTEAPPTERRAKRERKQRSYTLCSVCNIQLNSAAQAQIHYNGKSHQKRLKHITNGKIPRAAGTSVQGGPLLASLPSPGRPLQPQLDLKHFLPFRLSGSTGSSPLSLFPNFNTMDPVQKAVINHTFGVPQPLKKKQIISCNICHLRFNSTNQAEAHYKGHKHARKLKAMEAQKSRQRRAGEASSSGRDRDRDRGKGGATESPAPLMDTSLLDRRSQQADPEPSKMEVRLEEIPMSSEAPKPEDSPCVTPTPAPSSDASSSAEPATPPPQASPSPSSSSSQLSDPASDAAAAPPEGPGEPATEPGTDAAGGADGEDKDGKRSKPHLHCPVCKVTVNSASQLEAHNSGTKHKLMLEGQSVQPRRRSKAAGGGGAPRSALKTKRLGAKGSVGVATKSYQCEVCEIYVNSETQLSQHMNSRRHKDRLAGKPPKPKFSPHTKTQAGSSLANVRWAGYASGAVSAMKKVFSQYNLTSLSAQTKLALQKQLTKSLTAGFLPGPLAPPTLCAMATNPLAALRHHHHPAGTHTFIQTPFLGPALFRPAPGPLRATHTHPIIFSPY